jgi:uncharacterized protein (DUF58 family)
VNRPESAEGTTSLAWRPAALVLVVAAGFLCVAGVFARDPVPLFLALPLLLGPAAAAYSGPRTTSRARLEWSLSGEGPEVTLTGVLHAPPGVRGTDLRMVIHRPEPLIDLAPPERHPFRDRVEFRYRWSAPFPCLAEVAPPIVSWEDPLGLAEVRVPLEAEALQVERFPPEAMRIGAVRLRRTTLQPGEVRSRAVGSGGEFFAVRTAAPTDTPRQINWRATARRGRLLTNDFLLERTGDLLLLLDLRPTSLGPARDEALLSISRAAALGIATGFLNEKARVGLGLYDEFLRAVPLGTGRTQRYRIARALETARLATDSGPSERMAVALRRYFPSGVTTVLLSPLVDEESSVVLLRHLRMRGYPTIVLSPSPLPLYRSGLEVETAEEQLAVRLRRLLRRQQLGRAWSEAPVIDWEEYWSLTPFVRFLSAPSHRPRSST